MHKPGNALLYDADIDVHFSHNDAYGHVNSTHYLDYVTSSRFKYANDELKLSAQMFLEHKLGFFLIRTEMDFLKPIVNTNRVRVQSYALVEGKKIDVHYQMTSLDLSVLHSTGVLRNMFIDLNIGRACECPEWIKKYFMTAS